MCDPCQWKKEVHPDKTFFFCENCGSFSQSQPKDYVEEESRNDDQEESDEFTSCKHVWRTLGNGRCHKSRGKAGNQKYTCYKCEICGKFQRRTS